MNSLNSKKREVISCIKSGYSIAKLASKFNFTKNQIRYFLFTSGLKTCGSSRSSGFSIRYNNKEFKTPILKLFENGCSIRQISKKLRISKVTITKWLSSWGYKTGRYLIKNT